MGAEWACTKAPIIELSGTMGNVATIPRCKGLPPSPVLPTLIPYSRRAVAFRAQTGPPLGATA